MLVEISMLALSPEHITGSIAGIVVIIGTGLTVIILFIGIPLQPFAFGVIVNVTVPAVFVGLIGV